MFVSRTRASPRDCEAAVSSGQGEKFGTSYRDRVQIDLDFTAESLNDLLHYRQAEAMTRGFRREERIENPRTDFRG